MINNLMKRYFLTLLCLAIPATTLASITVPMHFTSADDTEESAGTVTITETKYGLMFTPALHGLTAGGRGFHIHTNPNCSENGMAAGGHFDPKKTNQHLGPYNGKGHLGDLPLLTINQDGTATTPVVAPRLHRLKEVSGHALMIHHAGDNYSDSPAPLGGGGARMACGIIK